MRTERFLLRSAMPMGALFAFIGASACSDGGRQRGPEDTRAVASETRIAARGDDGRSSGRENESARAGAGSELCRVVGSTVELPDIPEASGTAVSRQTPGLLWLHNDSGDPEVFALDTAGSVHGRIRIAGAGVEDWEDVAVGPCPGGSCLYVADIGDNQAQRSRIVVYRAPEPASGDRATQPAEAFYATYPDGPHDAEALFVTPDGGLFVVTKGETGPVSVYRFPQPLRPGATVSLEKVVTLVAGRPKRGERVTGAASSLDGRWVALRSADIVSFYRTSDLTSGSEGQPLRFDASELREPQGEGVALAAAGTVYLVGEGGKPRRPGTLRRLSCTLPS